MFSEIIYRPILNLAVFIYNTVGFHDFGISIIVMTVVVRTLLLPLSLRAARAQQALARIAPDIERIKKEHSNDTTVQSEKVMALYRENGANPLTGCLPILLQFPILIGMYQVFLNIFKDGSLSQLYHFITRPEVLNPLFLGFVNISVPNHILAVLAGVVQYFHARMLAQTQPSQPGAGALNKQMMYVLPVMIVVFGWNLPAGLALYWTTTTLFSIGEQLIVRRRS